MPSSLSKSSNSMNTHSKLDISQWLILAVQEAELALREIGSMLSGIDRGFDLWPQIHSQERWIHLLSKILTPDFARLYEMSSLARGKYTFIWHSQADLCHQLLERHQAGEHLLLTHLTQFEFENYLERSVQRLSAGFSDQDPKVRRNIAWLIGHFPIESARTVLAQQRQTEADADVLPAIHGALKRIKDETETEAD